MKYTQIPSDTFQKLQLNAGVLCSDFDVETGTVSGIFGATSGGVSFTATPEFTDFGEDIDNCPKNMLELKQLDTWEVLMSGTYVTVSASLAQMLVGPADAEGNKVTPRNDLLETDFTDVWWVGDYSDVNTGDNAGFIAIHLLNALSTAGFQVQSTDAGKGQFAFEFTGHFSMEDQDKVPFEVYVRDGGTTAAGDEPSTEEPGIETPDVEEPSVSEPATDEPGVE